MGDPSRRRRVRTRVSKGKPWPGPGSQADPGHWAGSLASGPIGYLAPGTWDPVPGTGSMPRAGYRAPKTEPGHRKTAHTGYASIPEQSSIALLRFEVGKLGRGAWYQVPGTR